MRAFSRLVSFAAAVILVVAAAAPLASHLARTDEFPSVCTCLVKMDCCLKGLCHMDEEPAADAPRWAPCSGSRHDEKAPPMTGFVAVCEARFEVEAPGRGRDVFFEGVQGIARHSNDAPDHVPIF